MKKLVLIAAMAIALTACKKDEETKPQESNGDTEKVEQYVGVWQYTSTQCTSLNIDIEKGSKKNELIIHGTSAIIKDKAFDNGTWEGAFTSDKSGYAGYKICFGQLRKLR